ncbi:MAG: glycosyltransferase family 4 protein [Methanomicrobiales archaeon]|nr:glycosyltransferase family 4 protein [Methanomicrobiales archaeon]
MKVLMIGDYEPQIGGPAHVVRHLARCLSREHAVSVIHMESPPYAAGPGHRSDGPVQVWQERLWVPGRLVLLQGILQKVKRALLLRDGLDLYHAHGPFNALIGLLDRKRPLVLTCHGYLTLESVANGEIRPGSIRFHIYRWVERWAVQRADAVIAVGSRLRDWVVRELGADPEKVFFVPNGVDTKRFAAFDARGERERFGISRNDFVVVFVKSFTEQSGIRYLLTAIREAHARRPSIRLIAIGGGPLGEELRETISREGMEGFVSLTDRIPHGEIPRYLNMADCCVAPSIPVGGAEEVFPLGVLEAMACGKPVVATAIGGLKEILEGGDGIGLLVPPMDAGALADAIVDLADHVPRAKALGENARRHVEATYTWERVSAETLHVYEYALASRRERSEA